jgi:hypothetical protein
MQHSLSPITTEGTGDDGNSLLDLYVQNATLYSDEPVDGMMIFRMRKARQ